MGKTDGQPPTYASFRWFLHTQGRTRYSELAPGFVPLCYDARCTGPMGPDAT